MKSLRIIIILLVLLLPIYFLVLYHSNGYEINFFRIHIRANSNAEYDQSIKYEIKEKIVDYITPFLIDIDSKTEAMQIIEAQIPNIEIICNEVLEENGFTYTASGRVDNEYFPTRQYDDYVLEAGNYDALIVDLGTGEGDNWWCVIYPPLCFVNKNCNSLQDIIYKSKILEIIEKFFG